MKKLDKALKRHSAVHVMNALAGIEPAGRVVRRLFDEHGISTANMDRIVKEARERSDERRVTVLRRLAREIRKKVMSRRRFVYQADITEAIRVRVRDMVLRWAPKYGGGTKCIVQESNGPARADTRTTRMFRGGRCSDTYGTHFVFVPRRAFAGLAGVLLGRVPWVERDDHGWPRYEGHPVVGIEQGVFYYLRSAGGKMICLDLLSLSASTVVATE